MASEIFLLNILSGKKIGSGNVDVVSTDVCCICLRIQGMKNSLNNQIVLCEGCRCLLRAVSW